MNLTFQKLTLMHAREIVAWRYESPHDFYNTDTEEAEQAVQNLLEPNNQCFEMMDDAGEFVGYCSFGREGQVPGGDYSLPALDLGMGIKPDRTGKGSGNAFAQAVLEFAQSHLSPAPTTFRVTIAMFNKRALRVWEKLGFAPVSSFNHAASHVKFMILMQSLGTK